MYTGIGLGLGLGIGTHGAPGVSGRWAADATPVDASRTGFATDTVLPEFGALAAPERVDPISTSLDLTEAGGVVIGTYSDAQGITCAVAGTYNPTTGAVAITGTCGDWDVSATATFDSGALAGTITVSRDSGGASSENRTWSATRGAAVALTGTHYYVDSRAGSALNDGLSAAAPLDSTSTITLAEGDTLWLARGTRLREMVYSAEDSVSCRAYGVGPRPILEGSVLAGTWSKTATYTNVWEVSHTPAHDNALQGSTYVPLLNGVAMKRIGRTLSALATDLTALDADPDACVVPQSDGSGTYTIYIYAAADPNVSGDVYEIPSRENGLWLAGVDATAFGIHGRACAGDNGPVRVANAGALQWDCVSEWGAVHNFLQGSGGLITHCSSLFMSPRWLNGAKYDGTGITTYIPTGTGVETASLVDDSFIQYPRADLEHIASGCTSHTSGGDIALISYDQIYISGHRAGIGGYDTGKVVVDRLYYERGSADRSPVAGAFELDVTRSRIYCHVAPYLCAVGLVKVQGDSPLTVRQSILTTEGNSKTAIQSGGATTVEGCTVDCGTGRYSQFIQDYGSAAVLLSSTRNVIINGEMKFDAAVADMAAGSTDYNQVYDNGPNWVYWIRTLGSTQRLTWYTVYQDNNWNRIHTDLDQNSVFGPTAEPAWAAETDPDRPVYTGKSDGYDAGHEYTGDGLTGHVFDFETDQPTGYAWANFVDAITP